MAALVVSCLLFATCATASVSSQKRPEDIDFGFSEVYIRDSSFATEGKFQDVTDIDINHELGHVFVLQRSKPPVTVWGRDGRLLFEWKTEEIGFPHSITLLGTDPQQATVLITDMAGEYDVNNTITAEVVASKILQLEQQVPCDLVIS